MRAEYVRRRGEGADDLLSARRWDRWRTLCGWAALVGAACWAVKFLVWAVLAAQYTGGQVSNAAAERAGPAVLVGLVTFLLPTAGSVLGPVSGSGLAAPWARTRPWFVGVPVAVLTALVVTLVFSTLINASTVLFSGASSQALRVEGSDLVAAALLTMLGLVLLIPTTGSAVRDGDPRRSAGPEKRPA
jgi:hypothetical protein